MSYFRTGNVSLQVITMISLVNLNLNNVTAAAKDTLGIKETVKSTMLYGVECWIIKKRYKSKLSIVKM